MTRDPAAKVSTEPGNVLVVQTAFIGDVVFASPLVHSIKEAHPGARVSLLVRPSNREVGECIPGVDEVLTFDKRGDESGPIGLLRTALRIRKMGFDLLVSPHRSVRSALLAWMSRVPLRVGYRIGLGKVAYHATIAPRKDETCRLLNDLKLLQEVGIRSAGTRLRLNAPRRRQDYVDDFLRRNRIELGTRLVGMCIGAYWPTKRWPPVYFASLGESLRERGYQPVLLGGPAERDIAGRIMESVRVPLLSCVGNTLREAAALLQTCDMTVGGDSGLTHMARALGVPTVLIYGPTDHRAHTFGDRTRVLTAKVRCRPCSPHGPRRCPERHHDCMRLVSPEAVVEALGEIANLQTPVPVPRENADRQQVADSSQAP